MELWNGEAYDTNSRLQQAIADLFLTSLKEYFPHLEENTLLLDIGCGNGRITASLLQRYGNIQVIGIDSSKDMIAFAHDHFTDSRIRFAVDKAEELKLIDNCSIDAITSFSCLHWVLDQQKAFQRMYEVLKPGGWVGLTFPAETGFHDALDDAFEQTMQELPWVEYFDKTVEEAGWYNAKPFIIKKQMEKIGFQIVQIAAQNFDFYFENRSAFRDWILASAQQLKLLPKKLQVTCAERIVELYLYQTNDRQPKNGQCIYQVDGLNVVAIKPEMPSEG